jgi:transposase-like protein
LVWIWRDNRCGSDIAARRPFPDTPPCPDCGGGHVAKEARTPRGQQRWQCRGCGKTFGPTLGTPLYRLRTPAAEVARSLLVVRRRGSLSAAEELTGHKYETLGRWLRAAAAHADAQTAALVEELRLSAVEVDAFWSFVQSSSQYLDQTTPRRPGWGHAGAA